MFLQNRKFGRGHKERACITYSEFNLRKCAQPELSSSFGPRETLDRKSTRRSCRRANVHFIWVVCSFFSSARVFYESIVLQHASLVQRAGCISSSRKRPVEQPASQRARSSFYDCTCVHLAAAEVEFAAAEVAGQSNVVGPH
jgi:hypothetical protein